MSKNTILPGILYPQPGSTLEVDKEGKWTATEIYCCQRVSVVTLLPRPGSAHPDYPFMSAVNASVSYDEADIADITVKYAGVEAAYGDKQYAQYSLGLSLTEEPLLSHKRYKDLSTTEKEAITLIGGGKDKDDQGRKLRDKVTSVLGKEALAKIDRGQTSYYSPRVTWKQSYASSLPAQWDDMKDIGNISEPEGPCPELVNRNWLKNGVTQTQDGKSYRLENEWLLSDREGWDAVIYND